jgi:signal transduction histidine kinase
MLFVAAPYRGMTYHGRTRGPVAVATVGVVTATTTRPPLLLRPLSPVQLQLLDVLHAVLVGMLCLFAAEERPVPPASGWREPAWVTLVAAVLLSAPTLVRRRWPLAAAVTVVVVASAALVTGVVPDYASAGPLVAVGMVLYIVGTSVGGRRSPVIAVAAVVTVLVAQMFGESSPSGPGAAGAAFSMLVIGSCWALGWTVRERRAQAARAIELSTARAVDEERMRIAREVHDIVAHSMSLISVKATIANHVADNRPDEMREALRVIEATSRTALLEMRRTLGALRAAEDPEPDPGGPDLDVLIDAAASTGLRVDFVRSGSPEMPVGLGTAVFRIVQESLTNVLKHAGATRCRVSVEARVDGVCVEVSDDGAGGSAGRGQGGQGLVGMEERVALYGGEFYAGPGPDGGWMIRARLEDVR